jgi:hypothetical protein
MCCAASRGIWADMLSLMSEAEPYGHLLVNGISPSVKQLARIISTPERECRSAIEELGAAGVYSTTDEGVIYSRRMVRDNQKAIQDSENGKGGGNPNLIRTENGGVNPPDKAQRLEARSQTPEGEERKTRARRAFALTPDQQAEFDSWWLVWPHKVGKAYAEKAFVEARTIASLAELIVGAQRYAAVLAAPNAPSPKHPQGWLNSKRWTDQPMEKPNGNGHHAVAGSGSHNDLLRGLARATASRMGPLDVEPTAVQPVGDPRRSDRT